MNEIRKKGKRKTIGNKESKEGREEQGETERENDRKYD